AGRRCNGGLHRSTCGPECRAAIWTARFRSAAGTGPIAGGPPPGSLEPPRRDRPSPGAASPAVARPGNVSRRESAPVSGPERGLAGSCPASYQPNRETEENWTHLRNDFFQVSLRIDWGPEVGCIMTGGKTIARTDWRQRWILLRRRQKMQGKNS